MTLEELKKIIAGGETLTVEFKSDRKGLPDRDLIEAVVALANTEGGVLLLGVEDGTGEVTGLNPSHIGKGTPAALIANRTEPSVQVQVFEIPVGVNHVFAIMVPKMPGVVGTKDGYYARRCLKCDGSPEDMPMGPFEIQQRLSSLQLIDFSAQPMPTLGLEHVDAVQRERIRTAIRRNNYGDKALLELKDEAFDKALGLVRDFGGRKMLTFSGVLFLTSAEIIREYIPTYEVAFQVLKGTNVVVNDYSRKPLMELYEEFELRFKARIEEREVMRGLYRMVVPNYDLTGFREALVNALVHRDYARLGAVIVKMDDRGLAISNPGGFVEGVTLENFMTIDPKSRNPLLADITKRIGLAERTGRGIDRIFEGTIRYGRPHPSYARTTATSVHLFIANAQPDLAFLDLLNAEEDKSGKPFPFESLVVMSALREGRHLLLPELSRQLQMPIDEARPVVEDLVERGILESQGRGSERCYMLSANVYKHQGRDIEYVRLSGFTEIDHEQMVLKLARQKGFVRRSDVMELCHLSKDKAYKLLRDLCAKNELRKSGMRKNTTYRSVDCGA